MNTVKGKKKATSSTGFAQQLSLFSTDSLVELTKAVSVQLTSTVALAASCLLDAIPTLKNLFQIKADTVLEPKTERLKLEANVAAIRLAKKIELENRTATLDEKKVLVQFSGWGSLAAIWSNDLYVECLQAESLNSEELSFAAQKWKKNYFSARQELENLLSVEEIQAAGQSTLNAYFTRRAVISSIWKAIVNFGFGGGTIVEPAAGAGHFIGLMPIALRERSKCVLIEKETLSGLLVSQQYPEAETHVCGFEDVTLADSSVDLIIGNVPFGDYKVYDSNNRDLSGYHIHNYFICRSARALRPGGLMALITTAGTFDSASRKVRQQLQHEGMELVGAVRLPSCTFEENAGTEVTTDILFMRKKVGNTAYFASNSFIGTTTIRTIEAENPETDLIKQIRINEYFAERPDMMIGEMFLAEEVGKGGLYRGDSQTLFLADKGDFEQKLDTVIESLPKLFWEEPPRQGLNNFARKAVDRFAEFSGHVKFGNRVHSQVLVIKEYEALKDSFEKLLKAEISGQPDEITDPLRFDLNSRYNLFVNAFGPLNKNRKIAFLESFDPEFLRVQSLEFAETNLAGKLVYIKSAILTERVYPLGTLDKVVTTLEDAVRVSLYKFGQVNVEYISQTLGRNSVEVEAGLIQSGLVFIDPINGSLIEKNSYLSGDLREKLAEAKSLIHERPELQANVNALELAIPPSIPLALINFQLGSVWLPVQVIADWIESELSMKVKLYYNPNSCEYELDLNGTSSVKNTSLGSRERKATELIESALNGRSVVVMKTISTADGDKQVKDVEATSQAIQCQEALQELFIDWCRANAPEAIETAFNERFNGYVIKTYEKPAVAHYPGANESIFMRAHQFRGVERIKDQDTMLAHVVGSGKTFTMISAAMEMIRLGRLSKVVIAVQNSTVDDFGAAWRKLYPSALIYVPEKADLEEKNRKRFLQRIATNRFDGIVLPQSFLKLIPDDPTAEEELIREELSRIEAQIKACERLGRGAKKQVKALNKEALRIEAKRKAQKDRVKDNVLHFGQLGVDGLFLDECFPAETPVFTNLGWLPIGQIVEEKMNVSALSYCSKSGKFEWKAVSNWLKKPLKKRLVKVQHSQGEFTCTEDHKVWTIENGYVKAGELTQAHNLYFTNVQGVSTCASQTQGQTILQSGMLGYQLQSEYGEVQSQQWEELHKVNRPDAPLSMVPASEGQKQTKEVLRGRLCSPVSKLITTYSGTKESTRKAVGEKSKRESKPEMFGQNEGEQSYDKSRFGSQNESKSKWSNIFSQGRQQSVNRTAENGLPGAEIIGSEYGVGNFNFTSQREISIPAKLLQSGFSHTRENVSDRNRWEFTQIEEVEIFRSAKNRNISRAGVVSVTVYQRASEAGFGFSDSDSDYVYDLTVEDNHNYFASGVLVSNCHKYKRYGFSTHRRNIKGIDTQGSQDAFQAMAKCRTIQRKGGRVVLATGTPISNTMAEAWTMLRFIAAYRLDSLQLSTFDQFAGTFGKVIPSFELTTGGQFKAVERFAKFVNVQQLSELYRSHVDVVLNEDVEEFKKDGTLPILADQTEELEDGSFRTAPGFTRILLPQTEGVQRELDAIREELKWFEKLTGEKKKENSHIPLVAFGKAKKATLDIRLLSASNPDEEGSKTNRAVAEILHYYKLSDAYKGTQLVFSDMYQSPTVADLYLDDEEQFINPDFGKKRFNLFEDIQAKLIAFGIPANEIAIVPQEAKKREPIFKKVLTGEIRVMLGSSERMGVGVNAQERLVALHHLDAPARPTDFEQRNGRIIRQGNLHALWKKVVHILTYGVEKTLDATAYGRLAIKQKFINQVLKGVGLDNTMSDVSGEDDFASMSFDQMMATLSGSQFALLYTTKNHELTRLVQQKKNFERSLIDAQQMVERARQSTARLTANLPQLDMETEMLNRHFPDGGIHKIEFAGMEFTEKWGNALEDYFSRLKARAKRGADAAGTIRINGVTIGVKGAFFDGEGKDSYGIIYSWGKVIYGEVNHAIGFAASLRWNISRAKEYADNAREQIAHNLKVETEFTPRLTVTFKHEKELLHLKSVVADLKAQLEAESAESETKSIGDSQANVAMAA